MKQFLLIGLLLFSTTSFAQKAGAPLLTDLRVIPPSPEAANLGRVAATPISYYTGTPQIGIPLLELKEGGLSVPISLSYNASGNRVEDVASWVGLGWTLNAGGVITRAVRGKPDDAFPTSTAFVNFFKQAKEFSFQNLLNGGPAKDGTPQTQSSRGLLLNELSMGCRDAEPDIFYFNFNGYSGQFAFDWEGNVVVNSEKDILIEPIYKQTGPKASAIESWKVTTETGTVYTFASSERTTQTVRGQSFVGGGCIPRTGLKFTSAWYLTSITDLNQEHHISFAYTPYHISYGLRASESIRVGFSGCNLSLDGTLNSSLSQLEFESLRLSTITTSSGQARVTFVPGALRSDTLGLVGAYNFNLRSLGRVQLQDAAGQSIKTFNLAYYPNNPTGRLTLQGVQEAGRSGQLLPAYRLEYGPIKLPADVRSKAQDHWGYYNGADRNNEGNNGYGSLIPAMILPDATGKLTSFPGANRDVNPATAQAGILTKIGYPTGGRTEFEYESNEYSYINNSDSLTNGNRYELVEKQFSIANSCALISPGSQGIQCAAKTDTFSLKQMTVIALTYDGNSPGGGNNYKPFAAILNAAGQEVFHTPYFGMLPDNEPAQPPQHGNITLLPGKYTVTAYACSLSPNPDANTTCGYVTLQGIYLGASATKYYKATAAGLRVKAIRDYATPSGVVVTKRSISYLMSRNDKFSSGVIYGEPNYAYRSYYDYLLDGQAVLPTIFRCNIWLRLAQNRTVLGTTQGSLVGYREVTITNDNLGQANGKTVYHYTSPVEYPDGINDELPFTPPNSQSYMTGLLKEQLDYTQEGNRYLLVKRLRQDHSSFSTLVPGMAVVFPGGLSVEELDPNQYLLGGYTNFLGHGAVRHSQATEYDPATGKVRQQDTDYTYDTKGTRLKTERYGLSPTTEKVVTHSYPADYVSPSTGVTALISRHVPSVPIESVTAMSTAGATTVVGATYSRFGLDQDKLRIQDQRILRLDQPLPQTAYYPSADAPNGEPDARLKPTVNIDRYDAVGNVVEIHRPQGSHVARLWGYGGSVLLVEAENATYTELVSVLGQAAVDQLAGNSPGTDAQVRQALAPLRARLPQSRVTIYTYAPLIGMTSQTDPDGRTITYEYDGLGRLLRTRDEHGRILSQQQYHYAGQ